MLSPEEALQKLFDLVKPLDKETVSIENVSSRVLRDNCVAKQSQPSFPMSAMDGYAVIADNLKLASESSPVKLKVIDSIES